MIGPDITRQAVNKVKIIRGRLLTAQRRQKSYADNHHSQLEFEVGDWVLLKVSPIMRFGKKGKLKSRFIGPYQIAHRMSKLPMSWSCQLAWEVFTRYSMSLFFVNVLVVCPE